MTLDKTTNVVWCLVLGIFPARDATREDFRSLSELDLGFWSFGSVRRIEKERTVEQRRLVRLGTGLQVLRGEAGEVLLELVAPLAENTPIKGVLAKGGGAYHICFEARDIEKTLADVARKGCVIVSQPVPAMAFDCRRIAWFFTPTGQLVELVETAFKDDETISSAPK